MWPLLELFDPPVTKLDDTPALTYVLSRILFERRKFLFAIVYTSEGKM